MSDVPNDVHHTVCSTLNNILTPESNISAPLSTAIMALGSAIDHVQKDVEQVRRMARTNWLLIINMPLPIGMSKISALQQIMAALDYNKPLFDSERDLLASDILYVNRTGLLCNMAFFVSQRHYDHIMSAVFQRKIVEHNKKLSRGQWLSIGRVLTQKEKTDYDMACALKRVIVAELQARKRADPHYPVPFILVCKRTIRLRIEKQYYTIEEAASRYSISTEAILQEKGVIMKLYIPMQGLQSVRLMWAQVALTRRLLSASLFIHSLKCKLCMFFR